MSAPGPWHWGEDGRSVFAAVNGVDRRIASVVTLREFHTDDVRGPTEAEHAARLANARLIAAAPDLLEACTEVLAAHNGGDGRSIGQVVGIVRAAIAKAVGK
jgi:hypothetical protein